MKRGFMRTFRKLPDPAQEQVMDLLGTAILWREWDESGGITGTAKGSHAFEAVQKIVAVFAENGLHLEAYT